MDSELCKGNENLTFSMGDNNFDCMCIWELDPNNHKFVVTVVEENAAFNNFRNLHCNMEFAPEYLHLTSSLNRKITIFQCIAECVEYCNQRIVFTYNFLIVGEHVEDFFNLNCRSLKCTIESSPIPIVGYIPYKSEKIEIEDNTIEILTSQKEMTSVEIEINCLSESISFNKITNIFYNLMDSLYLCLGFYPYTIKEELTLANDYDVTIHHRNKNKYEKGNSFSHWGNILVEPENIIFSNFINNCQKNHIAIEVFTHAVFANDLYIDLKLSIILQCVEGYMTRWHNVNKFEKSIKKKVIGHIKDSINTADLGVPEDLMNEIKESINGILGNINKQSFLDRIDAAFSLNENALSIVEYEKVNDKYKDLLSKSRSIRNQFAHMDEKKDKFVGNELLVVMQKYILLFRVLVLSDLGIKIDKTKLHSNVKGLDQYYQSTSQ